MSCHTTKAADFYAFLSTFVFVDAGVPCVPGYHGGNQDPQHLLFEAQRIGAYHFLFLP